MIERRRGKRYEIERERESLDKESENEKRAKYTTSIYVFGQKMNDFLRKKDFLMIERETER